MSQTQPVVLVTDPISAKTQQLTLQYIDPQAKVVFSNGDQAVLAEYLPQAQVLITSTKGISPEMLQAAGECRYIQKYGAGVNNIAIPQATRRRIPVGNTPATNSRSVAEAALTLILAVYKQVVRGHNALAREGRWLKTVLRDDNHELTGKTVGIVGMGNIGQNLVALLQGFRCRVLYYDAFRLSPEREQALGVTYLELDELLAQSDVVSLHVPLLDETRHMIDARRLALMKPEAVLINCARGGVVDERALYQALKERRLLGAGIDTFEKEPADQNNPLCSLDNVTLSPHNGGGTVEAVEKVVQKAAENINSILRDGTIAQSAYLVNGRELAEESQ